MAEAAHDLDSLSPEDAVEAPAPGLLGNTALDLVPAVQPAEPTPRTVPANILDHPAILRLRVEPEPDAAAQPAWSCAELAGRLCELSSEPGGAPLSAAFDLVFDAQQAGNPVAWIATSAATFYPPDVSAGGVDLDALVVVRAPEVRAAGRAADVLLRSGAYGLVVLDLGASAILPTPRQGRLVQLALKHDAVVLCLTEKPSAADSLGSLVSLRSVSRRRRVATGFACSLQAIKDKRRGPGWSSCSLWRGPEGLAC